MPHPLEILHQDAQLVAINKPPGLMVHRSRIDVTARQFAMQMLRDQIGQLVYPVHRIDRPTSGVLLFALNADIARELSEQFAHRTVEKTYLAIVRGHLSSQSWDEPLIEKQDRIVDKLARRNKQAQPAVTEFESQKSWTIPFSTGKYPHSRYSLVTAKPLTGRKHQIRRHLNHMAHPIVGDTTYGDRRHNRLFREQLDIHRLLLMAHRITFTHPGTQQPCTVEADVNKAFGHAFEMLDKFQVQ